MNCYYCGREIRENEIVGYSLPNEADPMCEKCQDRTIPLRFRHPVIFYAGDIDGLIEKMEKESRR